MQRDSLVVDASVAIKWLVEEEGSDAADALRVARLVAPSLIRVEVANVLRTMAARGTMVAAEATDLFALFQTAPVNLVEPDDALERRSLELAFALAHPVYDCLYLALAERMGVPMVSGDRRFLHALAGTAFEPLGRALVVTR
jgi:predicted nucleic acid-binding protein